MNEHGYCPNCKINFDGELIYETFIKQGQTEAEAFESALMYGATKTKGRWNNKIGIYDIDEDRTKMWKCPDCSYEWER